MCVAGNHSPLKCPSIWNCPGVVRQKHCTSPPYLVLKSAQLISIEPMCHQLTPVCNMSITNYQLANLIAKSVEIFVLACVYVCVSGGWVITLCSMCMSTALIPPSHGTSCCLPPFVSSFPPSAVCLLLCWQTSPPCSPPCVPSSRLISLSDVSFRPCSWLGAQLSDM